MGSLTKGDYFTIIIVWRGEKRDAVLNSGQNSEVGTCSVAVVEY